jgi:hypothetical protein
VSRTRWLALIAGVLLLLFAGRLLLRYFDYQASETDRVPATAGP